MRLSRYKTFLLSIAALAAMLKVSVAAEISERDLRSMEKRLQAESQEHKKLQAQATLINLELNEVSQEMIKAARLIQNNEDKISRMETELKQLQSDLDNAEKGFLKEDENLIKTLSALQNLALKPTEALFAQPLTPVDIIRSAMLLRETVPYLERNATRIRSELDKIEARKNKVEKQFKQIVAQKKILEKEHEKMRQLVQKKSRIRNQVEIKSVQTKKNVEKLASQANDLRDLLNKLEQQRLEKQKKQAAERQRMAEIKAREEARLREQKKLQERQSADLIKYKPEVINEFGDGFSKAKGQLPMPARGPVVTAYGEKFKGLTSKGILIKTRETAQVIAPFDGTVAFAGPFRGYGNLLIIEHGQGYLTLLAGMQNIDCEVGQMLLAGEPVGQMPNDNKARLYVELRHNNQPLNPQALMTN